MVLPVRVLTKLIRWGGELEAVSLEEVAMKNAGREGGGLTSALRGGLVFSFC